VKRHARRAALALLLLAGCAGPRPEEAPAPPRETAPDLHALQEDARARIERGDFKGAGALLERADGLLPGHPETSFLRGLLLEGEAEHEAALPHFRAAWKDDPDRKERRLALWRTLVAVAESRYRDDAFTEAWDLLEEAGRVDHGADLAYLQGTVAYALAQSLFAPEESPEDIRAVERRRWLALAEEAFQEAIDRNPEDADARFNLAAVLVAEERGPEAVEAYRRLLGQDPEDPELHLALAHAYEMSGKPSQGAVSRTASRVFSAGRAVDDVVAWAERRAGKDPRSAMAETLEERGVPDVIRVADVGEATAEVWIYRNDRLMGVFHEGTLQGVITWP
jgi:tetratricopeptide (TPR) repeat protein